MGFVEGVALSSVMRPAKPVALAVGRSTYLTWPLVGSVSVKNWKLLKKFSPE